MTLGEYIKQYRTSHGLSQRQFASMCNLSYGYISMLEKGVNTSTGTPIVPTLQTMRSLAGAMGTTIHKIASEVDDLYMDLTGEERKGDLFDDLLVHGEWKQPSSTEGLSEIALKVAQIVNRFPPESQELVLHRIQSLEQALQALDDVPKSE